MKAEELCGALLVDSKDKKILVAIVSAAISVANGMEDKEKEDQGRKRQKDGASGQEGGEGKRLKHDEKVQIDHDRIAERINSLDDLVNSKKYSQKKVKFLSQYNTFLAALDPAKTFHTASPHDIRMFLVHIERYGKTILHDKGCVAMGKVEGGSKSCLCLPTMAWGTLDSKVGMLRAIYRDEGYGTDWGLKGGNPAASPEVKKHLQACSLEQSKAHIAVKQAVPLYWDKLLKLSRYLEYHRTCKGIPVMQNLLLMRDLTFFRIIAQTGDRAGDLGTLMTRDIFWYNQKQGVVLKMQDGKVASVKHPRYVRLFRSDVIELCPVQSILQLVSEFKNQGFDLRQGYLFRMLTTTGRSFTTDPLTGGAINARLRLHLEKASLNQGETIHGARRGLAMMLTTLGVGDEEICKQLGWYSTKMCLHYTSRRLSVGEALASTSKNVIEEGKSLHHWCVIANRVF